MNGEASVSVAKVTEHVSHRYFLVSLYILVCYCEICQQGKYSDALCGT